MAKKETATSANKLPTHEIFVVKGEGEQKHWTKVGAAWSHGDGEGLNLRLSVLPISGRLVLRLRTEKETA